MNIFETEEYKALKEQQDADHKDIMEGCSDIQKMLDEMKAL